MTLPSPGSTPRTTVKRIPDRAVSDRDVAYSIIDASLVAHVAFADDFGQPFVLPVGCARHGDELVFHGSAASRLFRSLSDGRPVCATVTILDGVVVARSAFESSMNYRSVMALGRARLLDGDEKAAALNAITDHLTPGRRTEARPMLDKEVRATSVAALPLDEISVKVRTGGPDEPTADRALDLWAGVVPILETFGEPITEPDVPAHRSVPDYIRQWTR